MNHYYNKTKSDKSPYRIFHAHSNPSFERNWTDDYIQTVSIDPAPTNFGFRIQRRYRDGRIYPIVFVLVSFLNEKEKEIEKNNNISLLNNNIVSFLDKYIDIIYNSHYIFIERQMSVNNDAMNVFHSIVTYFMIKLKNNPLETLIIELNSKLKSKMLNAPKNLTRPCLKNWSDEKAISLSESRGDIISLNILKSNIKTDDLSDTIVQEEAASILFNFNFGIVKVNDNDFFIGEKAKQTKNGKFIFKKIIIQSTINIENIPITNKKEPIEKKISKKITLPRSLIEYKLKFE